MDKGEVLTYDLLFSDKIDSMEEEVILEEDEDGEEEEEEIDEEEEEEDQDNSEEEDTNVNINSRPISLQHRLKPKVKTSVNCKLKER